MQTEIDEEVETEVKEEDIVDAISTVSSAAEPRTRPRLEVLKSAMKKLLLHLGHFVQTSWRRVLTCHPFCSQ